MNVFNCIIEFLWPAVKCVCIFLECISGTINISQPIAPVLIFTVYVQLTWTRFYLQKTKCVKDGIVARLICNVYDSIPLKYMYWTSYLPAISKVCWVFDNFSLIFSKNSMFGYECVSPNPHISSRDEWPPDRESRGSRQSRPVGETRGDLRGRKHGVNNARTIRDRNPMSWKYMNSLTSFCLRTFNVLCSSVPSK